MRSSGSGATPVFVDCEAATGNLTADCIAAAVTPRTKAISVVHFVGIPCTMPPIMAIAERHGLKVIEDCAIAVGARCQGRHVGLFGDVGCFSFYPVKHITTGEGGMFVTRHRAVADAVRKLRAFGVDRTHGERTIPGMYEVPTLGLNYRMSEMQAALGRSQLRRIVENLARRRSNFEALKYSLASLFGENGRILDAFHADAASSHYCLSIVLQGEFQGRRDDIVTRLNAAGIGTSVYYPHPVPRLAYYRRKYGYKTTQFPFADEISDQSLALPVGPHIQKEDIEYMTSRLRTVLHEVRS